MFSEAIQKFLSKPLRETSYVVDYITEKIGDQNFFPNSNMNDKKAVADQEIANLDIRAMPFLIAKLIEVQESTQTTAVNNATNFLLVLASRRNPEIRASIIKKLIEPKSSKDQNAEFSSMLVNVDPEILVSIDVGTRHPIPGSVVKKCEYNWFFKPVYVPP